MYKKKNIFTALAMLSLLASIFGVTFDSISVASNSFSMVITSASTNINGRITTNTTWTLAESPYVIVDDVVVETDVFLTIEPGVVIKFTNGTNLIVDGALIANGNFTHPITFTSNATTPQPSDWGSIRFRDTSIDEACVIDWSIVEYASIGIAADDSSPKIANSTIRLNAVGVETRYGALRIFNSSVAQNGYGVQSEYFYYYEEEYPPPPYLPTIRDSLFENNSYGIYISYVYHLDISRSTFLNNVYGIYARDAYNTRIYESLFSNNEYGIWSSWGTLRIVGSNISYNIHGIAASYAIISKSIISENEGKGVSPTWWYDYYYNTTSYDSGRFSITYSTITANKENGIVSKGSSTIHYSNIYDNTPYDVCNVAPYDWSYADVNATNNWWGTTNETEIEQHIYDYYDDYNLRIVFYQPFLDSEVTIPPIAHDVAITDVTASPTSVSEGEWVYITVNVVNEGDFYETFNVSAYYDSILITGYQWPEDPISLDAGQSTTVWLEWETWGVEEGNYTISAEVSVVPDETDIADNTFINGQVSVIGAPPMAPYAYFTYSPYYPSVGEPVTFDASYSYDPDGYIVRYVWNYGDNTTGSGVITTHIYNASGTYAVILKVTDDDGQNATYTQYISVSPPMLVHDIAIMDVEPYPTRVIPGDPVTINVTVENQGDFNETFTVTVFYDSNNATLPQTITDLPPKTSTVLTFTWDTTGVSVGEYLIKAQVDIVPGEGDIGDNTFVDDIVVVAHRILSVEPSGEFDYSIRELVRIKIAALVRDAVTMEPVSNANVSIQIYDDIGNLWVSSSMTENPSGTGIYIWTSNDTIVSARIEKGVYLARIGASFRDGPTAYNMMLFHIDPPAEGANQTLYYYATLVIIIALTSVAGITIRKRRIANKKFAD